MSKIRKKAVSTANICNINLNYSGNYLDSNLFRLLKEILPGNLALWFGCVPVL